MEIVSAIVFFGALFAGVVLNFTHYMHMFQLGGYHASAQMKWLGANLRSVLLRHAGAVFGAVVLIAASYSELKLLIAGVCLLVFLVFSRPRPAKKKLVFTPRVIRMTVTAAVLYLLLLAPVFLFGMMSLPAVCSYFLINVLTVFMAVLVNFLNKPIEHLVNMHYINDAKRIIDSLPRLTVIGITGSYGKTSTKFYLHALLSAKYNVLMTPESYNTTMGVVKTIRSSLNATHDIFICEMGAKGVGEIKEICDIVKPKHSMITAIGPQHLESFKSLENIIKTKFEIADCITDGTVFLNYNNEAIRSRRTDKNVVSYGIGTGGLDYRAEDISVSGKGTRFTVCAPGGERKVFETKLIGAHNVENIVGAIAVAGFLGVSLDELRMPVARLESVKHRLQLIDTGDRIVIDDAFNSNPSGAKAALDVLAMLDGVRFLVTPGMVELGEQEYELNRTLGEQAAEACDYAVLIGEKQAAPIREGLLSAGFPEERIEVFAALSEGLRFIDQTASGGKKKIVLLENDLPDNY